MQWLLKRVTSVEYAFDQHLKGVKALKLGAVFLDGI